MQASITSWPNHVKTIEECTGLCREAFAVCASMPIEWEEKEWIEEQQARLNAWAGCLGVFASGRTSVEYRLWEDQSVYQLILQLLHSLHSNLDYYVCSTTRSGKETSSTGHDTWIKDVSLSREPTSVNLEEEVDEEVEEEVEEEVVSSPGSSFLSDHSETDPMKASQSIFQLRQDAAEAISRLNRISASIYRSGVSQGYDHVLEFVPPGPQGEDMVHEHEAYVKASLQRELKGNISRELRERTIKVIMRRWRQIQYRRNRFEIPAKEPDEDKDIEASRRPDLQAIGISLNEISTTEKQIIETQKAFGSYSTDQLQPYMTGHRQRTIQEGTSRMTESSMSAPGFGIPRPPKSDNGTFECPYCCLLSPAKDVSTAQGWEHHLFQDLAPYYCIFDDYTNGLQLFSHSSDWISHMQRYHVLPEWYCTVSFCFGSSFESEELYRQHMHAVHALYADTINDVRLNTLARINRRPKAEVFSECRFCAGIPPDWDVDSWSPLELQNQLQRHVGRHMQSLALISLPFDNMRSESCSSDLSKESQNAHFGETNSSSGNADHGGEPHSLLLPDASTYSIQQFGPDAVRYASLKCKTVDGIESDPTLFSEMADQAWLSVSEKQVLHQREHEWGFLPRRRYPPPHEDPVSRDFFLSYAQGFIQSTGEGDSMLSSSQKPLTHAICKLLDAPGTARQHLEAQNQHMNGTCNWLLQHKTFLDWAGSPNSKLLLIGNPGSGKTVASSVVIDNVTSASDTMGSLPLVVYHYFHDGHPSQRTIDGMLRSLIKQLLLLQDSIPDQLITFFFDRNEGEPQTNCENLMEFLKVTLRQDREVFIVLDAVGECERDAEADFQRFFKKICGWKLKNLHLFFTSRPMSGLPSSGFARINMAANTKSDVRYIVHERLRTEHKSSNMNAFGFAEYENRLVREYEGSLTWLIYQLDWLRNSRTISPRDNEYDKLQLDPSPRIWLELCNESLSSIARYDEPCGVTILQWMVHSFQPMSVKEIIDVIAVESRRTSHSHEAARLAIPGSIYGLAEIVVTADPEVEEPDPSMPSLTTGEITELTSPVESEIAEAVANDQILRFVHSSLKDCLVSAEIVRPFRHALRKRHAHACIARVCLVYLLHICKDPFPDDAEGRFPLMIYVAEFWIAHARDADDKAESEIITMAAQLLCSDISCATYLKILRRHSRKTGLSSGGDALYFASEKGLHDAVKTILRLGVDVNSPGSWNSNSALYAASIKGHSHVVQTLLECGADPNGDVQDEKGRKDRTLLQIALEIALGHGSWTIAQLLLEHGADTKVAEDGSLEKALQRACHRGNIRSVKLLLNKRANPNAEAGSFCTALQAASMMGYDEIVEVLLESGADPNAAGGRTATAPQRASIHGYSEIVEVLLKNGADPNATGANTMTAL